MKSPEEENAGPVIRDRRRIDPETGQVRDPGKSGQFAAGQPGSPLRGAGQGGAGQAGPGKHSVSRPGGAPGSAPPAPGGNDRRGGQDIPVGRAVTPDLPGDWPADDETAAALARLAERTADLQRLQAEYANYRKRVERDRIAVRERALASVLGELLPILDDIGRAREHEELSGGFKSVAESLESATTKLGLTSYGENGDPFDPNLHEALMHSYSADVTEPTCVRILQPGYKIGDRILRPARVAVAEPGDPAGPGGPADPGEPAGADTGHAQDAGAEGGQGADGGIPRASDQE
jgi:molecular chaperone GrpE